MKKNGQKSQATVPLKEKSCNKYSEISVVRNAEIHADPRYIRGNFAISAYRNAVIKKYPRFICGDEILPKKILI